MFTWADNPLNQDSKITMCAKVLDELRSCLYIPGQLPWSAAAYGHVGATGWQGWGGFSAIVASSLPPESCKLSGAVESSYGGGSGLRLCSEGNSCKRGGDNTATQAETTGKPPVLEQTHELLIQ